MSSSTDFKVTATLLALALAVGGAGVGHPLLLMFLGLAAITAAAYFAVTERSWRPQGNPRFALTVLALVLLLPLLQLIPLPPPVWQGLPGRELPAEIDSVLGWNAWRPLTLDVESTIRSFLTLLPAAVIFVGCLFLPTGRKQQLLWVVLAFALAGSALGIVQLATAGGATPYPSAHSGFPIGLFVNRNHNAALLLAAMPIAAAVGAMQIARGKPRLPLIIAALSALVIFAVVVLGTTSRMGLVLLPLGLATALFILFRASWRLVLPSIAALAALTLVIYFRGGFNPTLARFSSLNDARFDYWIDIQWALQQYALPGTGFGTFIPVYQSAERLDAVGHAIVNHAHNDYLEILLEGGAAAAVVLLLFFTFLAIAVFHLARSPQTVERGLVTVAAGSGIALLLLFSLVDYPLRMPALGAVFAVFCALLLQTPRGLDHAHQPASDPVPSVTPRPRPAPLIRAGAVASLIVLAVLVVQAGLSSQRLLVKRYAEAAAWAPWSTRAHERRSTEALLAGRLETALDAAYAALRLSPISAPALRSIGLVEELRGNSETANRLMVSAAALGWRDPLTQVWVIERALRGGEADKALQRAEALFRQERFAPAVLVMLLRAPNRDALIERLADALAKQPPWRRQFLAMGGEISPEDAPAFEQLLASLDQRGAGVRPDEVEPFLGRLLGLGHAEAAQRVWQLGRGRDLLVNGGFEATGSRKGAEVPLGWDISSEHLTGLAVGSPPGGGRGRSLRIVHGSTSATILSQRLMLSPGTYELTYRVLAQGAPGAALRWELKCGGSTVHPTSDSPPAASRGWTSVSLRLVVPEQNCRIQRLALNRLGGTLRTESWLDDVALRPVRQQAGN